MEKNDEKHNNEPESYNKSLCVSSSTQLNITNSSSPGNDKTSMAKEKEFRRQDQNMQLDRSRPKKRIHVSNPPDEAKDHATCTYIKGKRSCQQGSTSSADSTRRRSPTPDDIICNKILRKAILRIMTAYGQSITDDCSTLKGALDQIIGECSINDETESTSLSLSKLRSSRATSNPQDSPKCSNWTNLTSSTSPCSRANANMRRTILEVIKTYAEGIIDECNRLEKTLPPGARDSIGSSKQSSKGILKQKTRAKSSVSKEVKSSPESNRDDFVYSFESKTSSTLTEENSASSVGSVDNRVDINSPTSPLDYIIVKSDKSHKSRSNKNNPAEIDSESIKRHSFPSSSEQTSSNKSAAVQNWIQSHKSDLKPISAEYSKTSPRNNKKTADSTPKANTSENSSDIVESEHLANLAGNSAETKEQRVSFQSDPWSTVHNF